MAERRFTDEQIEEISNRAAEKALAKIYGEVGKGVVTKLLWLAGAALIGLAGWLSSKGWLST